MGRVRKGDSRDEPELGWSGLKDLRSRETPFPPETGIPGGESRQRPKKTTTYAREGEEEKGFQEAQ